MTKIKSNVSILAVLMLLCSGVSADLKSKPENIFSNHLKEKAKDIHVEARIYKESIGKYFVDAGLLEAEIIGDIRLKQQEYPEPITLFVKKVPSGAIKQIKMTQDWDNKAVPYCRVNSWAKYDVDKKRVLINVDSISCELQKLEFGNIRSLGGYHDGWYAVDSVKVGASIEGTIYDADFVKGLRGEVAKNGDIEVDRYNTKVLIEFHHKGASHAK